jgi:hypothetical protein
VVDDGPIDLLSIPGFVSHLEVLWEAPGAERYFGHLASFSRLIMFDKRGQGLSDGDLTTPVAWGRAIADDIPNAHSVELPGDDHLPLRDADQIVDEIEEFVTGERAEREQTACSRQ